ncbi:hypothetical protein NA78x_000040 [Anatilimnocola sp. NA78]|uniref:hypothetical protein n=1 Tax=Anatilimnocola sp. NA78 TaxID=3415683 RepID=UPI003CE4CDC7
MNVALTLKELRETAGLAALGLIGLALFTFNAIGWVHLEDWTPFMTGFGRGGGLPFLYDSFESQFAFCAGVLGIAFGFKQTLADFQGDAHLFMLHRPVSRQTIFLTKLVVGFSLYLLLTLLPLVAYALWAATNGAHPSPFAWSMTVSAWITWLAASLCYLGAFLAGIRPAQWQGTRLLPLVATATIAMFAWQLAQFSPFAALLLIAATGGMLVAQILFVVEVRDFA